MKEKESIKSLIRSGFWFAVGFISCYFLVSLLETVVIYSFAGYGGVPSFP